MFMQKNNNKYTERQERSVLKCGVVRVSLKNKRKKITSNNLQFEMKYCLPNRTMWYLV